jgi:flagellar assembly protein FliH
MNLSTETQKPGADTPVRKFMFERSFDDAAIVHRAQERKPVLMKPEQIDALKKEANDAGFEAGKIAGKEDQTARLDAILAKVDKNLTVLIGHMDALAQEQEAHTRQLALAIVKKILPTFTARAGLQEVEELLSSTIREMAREPRLVVRVHEAEFDAVNERVQAIALQRAYSGKAIVLADAEVAAGDCRIEWADGGIERNAQSTMDSVEQTLLPSS